MSWIRYNSKGKELSKNNKKADLIADGATETDSTFKPNLVAVMKNQSGDVARYCETNEQAEDFRKVMSREVFWLEYKHAAKTAKTTKEKLPK